jgi:FtsP/CotA-like multicopper oxidase with cupredoxin domain/flagellar motor protein MotB
MYGPALTGRRIPTLAVMVVIAVAISLVSTHSTGRATSGGSSYAVPLVTDTDPAGDVVETSIVADETDDVAVGLDRTANLETYNGTAPGPTFVLDVGDTVIVHYENHLDHPSAIHWHGIEVANQMDGTTFTQNEVAPGGDFLYTFTVTRPGLFWYHPHHHSSTNQVFKGLYGMIIVRDPNEAALQDDGTLPPPAQTKPIVLSDATVCKAQGANDTVNYPGTTPHVSGVDTPAQNPPSPAILCDTGAIDENGAPRGPFDEGDIPNNQTQAAFGRTNEGQTVLTNGKNVGGRAGTPSAPGALAPGAERLPVLAGQGLRLQILNAASTRYMRLRLTTSTGAIVPLVRVGGEGGLLNTALVEGGVVGTFDTLYDAGEQLLPPGSRADVVAAIPSNATGTLTMWTEDYFRTGNGYSNIPTVPVMHLRVDGIAPQAYTIAAGTPLRSATGDPVELLGTASANLLNPATFTPQKTGTVFQTINLQTVANTELRVDGYKGEHDVPGTDYKDLKHVGNDATKDGSSRYGEVGETYELFTKNATNARHPFHLHGFSIQPLDLTKSGDPTFTFPLQGEFRDNVDIPPGYTLRFRMRTDDRPLPDGSPGGAFGRWVFHCHIFFHATDGMLSELVITNGAGNERPDIDAQAADVQVQQGQTATMKGSFKDRDGDPVTLSASVGSVTDDGGGKWTWTYPTGLDDSRLVYVRATDSNGLRANATFDLGIANTPPTLVVPGPHFVPSGGPLSFNVQANDVDAVDPVTISAANVPSGLAFAKNGRTGTVSGNVVAPPGVYPVTFTASDGKNAPVTVGTVINVTPALPGPRLLQPLVDKPERLVRRAITVGCRLDRGSLQTCAADVLAARKRVGRATRTSTRTGLADLTVRVPLNKATRRKIARSLPGVAVAVGLSATEFGSPVKFPGAATTRVVPPRIAVLTSFPSFAPGGSTLTRRTPAALRRIARLVRRARRVTCTAYPDANPLAAASRRLAAARAAKACAALRRGGLKATFRRVASRRLRSARRGARARAQNRRVLIVILR